jgi:flagellar protein FlaF
MTDNRTRGLTTAASLIVVFFGFLVAAGTFYSASATTAERVREAKTDATERAAAVARTDVSIASASWDLADSNLTVAVNNTGEHTLDAAAIDTVVDGIYVGFEDYERVEVDGRATTVWRPGEQLVLEDDDTITQFFSTPEQVKFVTGTGVADRATVVSL